jgi:pyruvate dehydrogenase E1 component alpha subunit
MAAERFEGFDAEVVRERVAAAADYARAGNGPVLLEVLTYRFRGHSMSDPAKYRPKGELEEKKLSDPLLITAKRLTEDFGVSEAELEAIKTEVYAVAQEAWDFAEQSPDPDVGQIYDHIYAPDGEN